MNSVLFWLIVLIICHQIMTIWTYSNLRKEDRGIDTSPKTKVSDFLQTAFLFFPMFGNALYDLTLGLVDRFRERRLCNMLVERDDKIKILEEKTKNCYQSFRLGKSMKQIFSNSQI